MDRLLAAPESEAFILSDSSSSSRKPSQTSSWTRARNTVTANYRSSQPSYHHFRGKGMRKGRRENRRAPTAVPPGEQVQRGVRGGGFQRLEDGSKPGGPEARARGALEARRIRGCAQAAPPLAARVPPGPGNRCSRSLRRPLGRGGRRALVRNHYRNEFALLFTKQSFHQKRNKITTYHTLS